MELSKDHADGTFRTIYTVRYAEVVIILHAFQKKSKKGIETPKQDKELIYSRIKLAEIIYKEWKEKRGKK
jgi:phage-related protein